MFVEFHTAVVRSLSRWHRGLNDDRCGMIHVTGLMNVWIDWRRRRSRLMGHGIMLRDVVVRHGLVKCKCVRWRPMLIAWLVGCYAGLVLFNHLSLSLCPKLSLQSTYSAWFADADEILSVESGRFFHRFCTVNIKRCIEIFHRRITSWRRN